MLIFLIDNKNKADCIADSLILLKNSIPIPNQIVMQISSTITKLFLNSITVKISTLLLCNVKSEFLLKEIY